MELSILFELISTSAVVFGIFFGLIQLRQYRLSRKRESALFLLNSYQTREFVGGIFTIQDLPSGLTRSQVEERLGEDIEVICLVMSTWETIGILLFNHEVTIEMIDQIFSGPILFCWEKLEIYVHELRRDLGRETLFEWFQWLADQMKTREKKEPPVPAYLAYQDWE